MERINCQISNCKNKALVAYGSKWICGECMMRIINKQKEKQDKEMEELGDAYKDMSAL